MSLLKKWWLLIPFVFICGIYLGKFIIPCPKCPICEVCPTCPEDKYRIYIRNLDNGETALSISKSDKAFSIIITDGVFKSAKLPTAPADLCKYKYEYYTEGDENGIYIEFDYENIFHQFNTETLELEQPEPEPQSESESESEQVQ